MLKLFLWKTWNEDTPEVHYLPMHAVRKESSTTTKVRPVFDASMKSTSVSLNYTLMVGPTVHPSVVDVLLQFCKHRIAIFADISKMYRAVELPTSDPQFHCFMCRSSPNEPLEDSRMTRYVRCVLSLFVSNM